MQIWRGDLIYKLVYGLCGVVVGRVGMEEEEKWHGPKKVSCEDWLSKSWES